MNLLDRLQSTPADERFFLFKEIFNDCSDEHEKENIIQWMKNTTDQAPWSGDFYLYIGKYYLSKGSSLGEEYLLKSVKFGNLEACKLLVGCENTDQGDLQEIRECQFQLARKFIKDNKNNQGFHLMREVADQGHLEAMYDLGILYRQAVGVQRDLKASLYWLTKAAMKVYGPAAYLLGKMYEKGEGVAANKHVAEKWYRMGISSYEKESSMKSYFALAMLYERKGNNSSKAFGCWENLSILGDREAQYHLGMCYYKGQGVDKDKFQAQWWLKKASLSGHHKAEGMLKKIC